MNVSPFIPVNPGVHRSILLSAVFITAAVISAFGQAPEEIAISNVTIIDGTDRPPIENATIVWRGGRITHIASGREIPARARVVDGTGKYLIPGLWNNDLHGPNYDKAPPLLKELIANGVTTVRDMGAPLTDIVRLRDAIGAGTILGPRLFIAGPLMEGPVPIQMGLIVDLFSDTQAHEEVRELRAQKVDYIEVDTTLTPELYAAVADEARRQNLPLVGHIPANVSARDIVAAGQVDVEHLGGRFLNVLIACSTDEQYFNQITAKTYKEILLAVREKRKVTEPQFKAEFGARLLASFNETKAKQLYGLYAEHGVAQTPTLHALKTLWETNKENNGLNEKDMKLGSQIFEKDLAVVKAMRLAGVRILAGTDGPYGGGGDALHDELELLVRAGLTPLQTLQAASRDAATAMGVSNQVGTLEEGKTADMVLLDADPLSDIANTRKVAAVVLGGHFFSDTELKAMRSH
jgi:cytosine/adenosine deaminase-related metal-dependent hydrolase